MAVFPDGRALNIQEGALRMRYRDSFTNPQLLTPNEVYKVSVDMRAIGWYLPPGHRLRLQISSSNFPRLERNLNTGGNNYNETVGVVARNRVYRDSVRASAVMLPVLDDAGLQTDPGLQTSSSARVSTSEPVAAPAPVTKH